MVTIPIDSTHSPKLSSILQNESTKDLPQRVVRDTFISLLALRCVKFLSPKRYNRAVFIYLLLYLFIKTEKNILKMNKEVRTLLPKKT